MIFPHLELEGTVQVNDRTRLNGLKTFITQGEEPITLIEITPEVGEDPIDVTALRYLDWVYSTDGEKTVSIAVTTDGSPEIVTRTLLVVSEEDDNLFSTDTDLIQHEPDILQYVRSGRNSFLDFHRSAQSRIIAWLDEHRYMDQNGNRITIEQVTDIEEFRTWSKFLTLQFIFENLSNAVDDIFHAKSTRYAALASEARNRGVIRIDVNADGEITNNEKLDNMSFYLLKR